MSISESSRANGGQRHAMNGNADGAQERLASLTNPTTKQHLTIRRPSDHAADRAVSIEGANGTLDEDLLAQLDEVADPSSWLDSALQDKRLQRQKVRSEGTSDTSSLVEAGGRAGSRSNALLSLDGSLAKLSTMLTIARQDTLMHVDSTMAHVTSTMPRLGLEMRLMREAALSLKDNISTLRTQANQADLINAKAAEDGSQSSPSANAVLQRLTVLHALHAHMSAARDVLSLAESWSTLSTDVNAFLAEAKYEAAAARVTKAKSSLAVFERTPEFEHRKRLLESLVDSLEAKISPSLIDAIRDRDVGQARRLLAVLATVDRHVQLLATWRRIRSEDCVSEWVRVSTTVRDLNGAYSKGVVASSLRRFADVVVRILEEEHKVAKQALPIDTRDNVNGLSDYILAHLDPSLSKNLSLLIPQTPTDSNALLNAVEFHDSLRYMAIGVSDCVAQSRRNDAEESASGSMQQQQASQSPTVKIAVQSPELQARSSTSPALNVSAGGSTAEKESSHSRRLSVRRVVSSGSHSRLSPNDLNVPDPLGSDAASPGTVNPSSGSEQQTHWQNLLSSIPVSSASEDKIFTPMLDYQLRYQDFEQITLPSSSIGQEGERSSGTANEHRNDANLLIGKDVALNLRKEIGLAVEAGSLAASRSRAFTYGLGCESVTNSIGRAFASIIARNKHILDQRISRAHDAAQDIIRSTSNDGQQAIGGREVYTNPTGGFSEAGSSSQGAIWKAFEEGMELLDNLKSVAGSIRKAEQAIADQHLDLADFLLTPVSGATKDTLRRICTDKSGTTTAPFRLLLENSSDRLRTGELLRLLKRVRTLANRSTQKVASATSSEVIVPSAQSHSTTLLSEARSSLLDQTRALQRHLANVILSQLTPHLETYAGLAIWSANRLPGSLNEYDLTMPTFSLSPTEDMSRIGEALLDLPRLLEVWSDRPQFHWAVQGLAFCAPSDADPRGSAAGIGTSDSLQVATVNDLFEPSGPSPKREKRLSAMHLSSSNTIPTMGTLAANASASPSLDRKGVSTGAPSAASSPNQHRHTPSVASIATLPARGEQTRRQEDLLSANTAQGTGSAEAAQANSGQSALQSYLTSISMTLVSHLVSLVLPSIAQLTEAGASQLAADLDYLLTILSALNVSAQGTQPSADADAKAMDEVTVLIRILESWKDTCQIKDQEGRRLRHLTRTGQAGRTGSLGTGLTQGTEADEDRLRSLLGTQAFDMVSRMRGW